MVGLMKEWPTREPTGLICMGEPLDLIPCQGGVGGNQALDLRTIDGQGDLVDLLVGEVRGHLQKEGDPAF